MTTKKPLRVDAERNRQRVLEVAQAVFASEGLSVPIDEIARRAGLGVGTLYRHFPTKEALFEAIVIGRLEEVVAFGHDQLQADDPGEAFFAHLRRLVEGSAAKKDFIEALEGTGIDIKRAMGGVKKELGVVMAALLTRAQAAGAVRKDVGLPEVMALVTGAFASIDRLEGGPNARERLLNVICDGLRQAEVLRPGTP